ncbi:MAG TPA: hypothetical protein VHZ56_05535, partial [Devosia sp.]|nr:hypothetical protein [Devosia sp.]
LIPKLLERFTLRPDWTASALATVLADAARKSDLGTYSARIVGTPDGRPLGLYLMHIQPHRHASVLQLMSTQGREGVVLDRAIAYATDCGAVAIRGRAQPDFLDALAERRAVLVPQLATVVHARDKAVLEAFRNGTAFFTGLAGENWMRLNGDRF